jgi:hypothetical protein
MTLAAAWPKKDGILIQKSEKSEAATNSLCAAISSASYARLACATYGYDHANCAAITETLKYVLQSLVCLPGAGSVCTRLIRVRGLLWLACELG